MTRVFRSLTLQRFWLFLPLLFGLLTSPVRADSTPELLVLVSQRNAETIAEAVKRFHQQHPGYRITARSDTQLWEMPAEQIDELFQRADMVLGLALFGASVNVLAPPLERSHLPQLIMNSDHRLIRLSQLNRQPVFDSAEQLQAIAGTQPSKDFATTLDQLAAQHPRQAPWIAARRYWQAGGIDNTRELFVWAFQQLGATLRAAPPRPRPRLRWQFGDQTYTELPSIAADKSLLVVLDHAGGDRPADSALLSTLCEQALTKHQLHCLSGLAYWGQAGVEAATSLQALQDQLAAIVMLQDFVMGGGEGREAVTETLRQLNVPVIKAIKSRDRSALERQLSSDGLADDKVYYQVAMPELQGASQPLVIAAAGTPQADPLSGIRIQAVQPVAEGIAAVVQRAANWQRLQQKDNADKRIALVYYNHPPGRHNIGADNLDVPASLWRILQRLNAEGYNTGTLPDSPEALLDLMQRRGINLPNDAGALATLSGEVTQMTAGRYRQWFATLPDGIQREMIDGPFGLLQSLADGVKLAFKEDLIPKAADKVVFVLAPVIAVIPAFVTFSVVPFGPEVAMFGERTPLQLTDMPVAVLFVMAIASIGIYGIVLGGWSSGSTYSLLGGLRSSAQMISYEVSMGLALIAVFIYAGSLSTSEIVAAQDDLWFGLILLPSFVIYVISMVGEVNRAPFDLPEAEGELVGGFHTEYSSLKFALFFLAEYINMATVSALATTLFLGGWHAPFWIDRVWEGANEGYVPVIWFFGKVLFFIFMFIWLRGSLPRLRYDQFMAFGWKVLIPVALAWTVLVASMRYVSNTYDIGVQQVLLFGGAAIVVVLALGFFGSEEDEEDEETPPAPEGGYPVPPMPAGGAVRGAAAPLEFPRSTTVPAGAGEEA